MGRRERIKAIASTYYGRERNVWKLQMNAVFKSLQKQYYNRRTKKRDVRRVWNRQINGATREHGISYSTFINSLALERIMLNRKMLANLAQHEPMSFRALVEQVRDRIMDRRAEELQGLIQATLERKEREDLQREWNLKRDREKKIDIEALILEREKEIVLRAQQYPNSSETTPTERRGKPPQDKRSLKAELELQRI
eukprot:GGOE01036235.1.p1 GENE.GGOE01036235.1~~GGOE01036235.1.p1  ORF type:complete len:213 (-),score=65.42 GGOE01036235.1:277-867(-)